MKKVLCVLLAILLCASGALAEGAMYPKGNAYAEGTDALLKNPRDAYEYYMEETDGSDQLVFMLLDIQNDEEELTADGSAVTFTAFESSEDGMLTFSYRVYVFQTDYGKVLRMDFGTEDLVTYCLGEFMYIIRTGTDMEILENDPDELESAFTTAYFPFVYGITLNSMRNAEDGAVYYLISDENDNEYEYKTDSANRIEEMRVYSPDGDDHTLLAIYEYDVCEAPVLPDQVVEALNAEE